MAPAGRRRITEAHSRRCKQDSRQGQHDAGRRGADQGRHDANKGQDRSGGEDVQGDMLQPANVNTPWVRVLAPQVPGRLS